MLLDRPAISLPFNLTPVASVVAAAVADEDPGLIEPLMESLEHDLLPRDGDAAAAFGVRLHRFEAAVERALRDMESADMSEVRAQIDIAAPPEAVYDLMLDPERLHEWVTIHRKVNHADSGEPRKGYADGSDAVSAPRELQSALDTHRGVSAHTARRGKGEGPRAPTPAPVTGSHPTATAPISSTRTSSRRRADCWARRPAAWWWAACPNVRRTVHCNNSKRS